MPKKTQKRNKRIKRNTLKPKDLTKDLTKYVQDVKVAVKMKRYLVVCVKEK
jgi:hypothetical protein